MISRDSAAGARPHGCGVTGETIGERLGTLGNSGTGKTHVALGLGLAACQKGLSVGFTTAAALVHELIEARDEKQLLRFQKEAHQLQAPDHRRTAVQDRR